jgi:hypothetical protein
MTSRIFLIILITTLSSCSDTNNSAIPTTLDTNLSSKQKTSPTEDTFPIKQLSYGQADEGWGGDIRLSFTQVLINENATIYKVNSTYEKDTVGFEIAVPNGGFSKLKIRSSGSISNNFIRALSTVYKQKIDTTLRFADAVTADCVNMGNYIDSLSKEANSNYNSTESQYKLFFQGKKEDDYAELYLNINPTEHWIELAEKDEEYRAVIIRILTQK